jgi:trehalose synthase
VLVNALQRQATVIVKKSLEVGFGLGVTEAMWKRRPVVATRVGGHRDQIQDGIKQLGAAMRGLAFPSDRCADPS